MPDEQISFPPFSGYPKCPVVLACQLSGREERGLMIRAHDPHLPFHAIME